MGRDLGGVPIRPRRGPDIPPNLQRELARAARTGGRVRLPGCLARQLVSPAYLGQLDVRPVASPVPDSRSAEHALEFWIEPKGKANGGARRLRITGRSDVEVSSTGRRGEGASFFHRVTLEWHGSATLKGERVTELLLYAEGRERLRWGNPALILASREDDVTRLPADRRLDVNTAVRYGVVGAPIPDTQAWNGEGPTPTPEPPARR